MFEEIDTIPWAELEHAYGKADDVPGQIRALLGSQKDFDAAIYELFGNIWHQNSVYSASAHAVPFLGEALELLDEDRQVQVIELLSCLAQGHGYYDVHQHAEHLGDVIVSQVDDLGKTLDSERNHVRATTLAVFDLWPQIEDRLRAESPVLRAQALHLLAVLGMCDNSDLAPPEQATAYLGVRPDGTPRGQFAQKVVDEVDAILSRSNTDIVRASALQAVLKIGRDEHPALAAERAIKAGPVEQWVVMRACALRTLATRPSLTADLAALLIDTVRRREEIQAAVRNGPWPWDGSVSIDLMYLATRLSEEDIDRYAEDLLPLIEVQAMQVFNYDGLLALVLGVPAPKIGDEPCAFGRGRRLLVDHFTRPYHGDQSMWFWWPRNGNAGAACKRIGVPHDRKLWRRWLGLKTGPYGLW